MSRCASASRLLSLAFSAEHDLMGVRTEAEKYLMLSALNLVECVTFVGAVKTRQ
jgi:hypothetical protein